MQQNERKRKLQTMQNEFEIEILQKFQKIENNDDTLKEFKIFLMNEDEIIEQWNLLKNGHHKNMFEILNSNDNDMEIVSYSILFDLFVAAYNVIKDEYEESKRDTNSRIIQLILLTFMQFHQDRSMDHIDEYVMQIIDGITAKVFERYDTCLKDDNIINRD